MTSEVARGRGRPPLYNEAMQAKADEYLRCYKELDHVVPSRAGLACYLGVSRSVTFLWEQEYADFLNTLEAINALQECLSLNGGLKGGLNSTIVKLVLANHGYSEKIHNELTSPDGSMSPKRELTKEELQEELRRRGLPTQIIGD